MLWLVLVASLAHSPSRSPSVGIVISRRTAISRARASALAEAVYESLRAQGISGVVTPEETTRRVVERGAGDPEQCDAQRACVARIGKKLRFDLMISIDLGTVLGDVAMNLEAVDSNGARLVRRTAVVPRRASARKRRAILSRFATAVRSALQDWHRATPSVASTHPSEKPSGSTRPAGGASPGLAHETHPVVAETGGASEGPRIRPTPVLKPAPSVASTLMEKPGKGPSRLPGYLTGAGALVTAGTAVALTLIGLHQKSSLQGTGGAVPLTWTEANARADSANRNVTFGLVSATASAALTGLAIYFFTRGD